MSAFNSIHITGTDWPDLCDRALAEMHEAKPGRLAFIYVAGQLAADTDRILDRLRSHSGIPHWVGCTGLGLCSHGRETYAEAGLSILVTPFGEDDFRIIPAFDQAPEEWLSATRQWRENRLASVAIVHGDPGTSQLPELLHTLADRLQGGFLVGGVASAESLPVQIADRATGKGLSGVLFGGQINIRTGLSKGCSLIGSKHRVTACRHNVIETIDDRPALEVFKQDIGEILA
ncbi:MAG: hypothetical protein KJN79_11350, partial [Gammaproteobacteria bacterium]|nr:hypothetical protein [Gammaproteobacteria bacterium]